jgi:hypothetical protein
MTTTTFGAAPSVTPGLDVDRAAAARRGFRIAAVPARTRYFDDASSISVGAASVYGLKTLGAVARLMLHRRGIVRSRKFEA